MTAREDRHSLGWARVIALANVHGFQHIAMSSLPPVFRLIRTEFALSYSQLGLLASLPSLCGGLLQLPAGILADRVGKMRVLLAGFGLLVTAVFFSGLAPTFAVLLVLQLMRGVGDSVFHPTTYALISQGSPRHRLGRSMTIHTMGGFAGTAVGLVLVAGLAERLGWRTALMVIAVPGFLLLALLRLWFGEPASGISDQTAAADQAPAPATLLGPLQLIFGAAFMAGVSQTGMMSFLPTFLGMEYGMTLTTASAYHSLLVWAGVASMVVGGLLADRMNRLNMVICGGLANCAAIAMFSLWAPPRALLALAMVATGVTLYLTAPAYTALISAYSGGKGQGRLYGLSFAGSALGGSLGALLVGYLADVLGFRMAFMAVAIAALIRASLLGALKIYDIRHPRQVEGM